MSRWIFEAVVTVLWLFATGWTARLGEWGWFALCAAASGFSLLSLDNEVQISQRMRRKQ